MEKININGTFGEEENNIEKVYLLSQDSGKIDSIYVTYNDGQVEKIDKPEEVSYEEFATAARTFLAQAGATSKNRYDKWYPVKRNNNYGIDFDLLDNKYDEQHPVEEESLDVSIDDSENEEDVKYSDTASTANHKLVRTLLVAGTCLGVGYALASCTNRLGGKKEEPPVPTPTPVVSEDTTKSADIGNDAANYQSDFLDKFEEGITDFNTYAHKFYHAPITEDEIKSLKEMGITIDETKNYANEGLDAEEVYAAMLRWGSELTNEELAMINSGENIDIEKVMSSAKSDSNRFEEDIIMMLLMDEELDFDIQKAIPTLSDKDAEEFNQFKGLYKEFKTLKSEDKIEEAHEKMREIKKAYSEYAFGDNSENGRVFGLTVATWGTVFSVESQIAQFRDKVTYTFFDTNTGKEVEKTFETNTWDEVTMDGAVLGFKNCSEVSVNGESKYAATIEGVASNFVYIIDEPSSISDLALSNEISMMESYNEFIEAKRVENANMDGAYAGTAGTNAIDENYMATNSDFDKLTYQTLNINPLLETINAKLEEAELNGVNKGYYNLYISQKAIEFKNAHFVAANGNSYSYLKPGDTVTIGTFTGAEVTAGDIDTGVMKDGGTVADAVEQAKKDWENEGENRHDATDNHGNYDPAKEKKADEEEQQKAEQEQLNAQDVHNAAFNYALGDDMIAKYPQYAKGTSLSYDPSWASSSDEGIRNAHDLGIQMGSKLRDNLLQAERDNEQAQQEQNNQNGNENGNGNGGNSGSAEVVTEEPKEETPAVEEPETPVVEEPETPAVEEPKTDDEGITYEDPTLGEGFAPVVEDETPSYTAQQISDMLDQMLAEAANEEEDNISLTK